MSAKTFELEFDGYWREITLKDIPRKSGVFVVYEGNLNNANGEEGMLYKIIYIGEGENVHDRILRHEKWHDWEKQCKPFTHLCFTFASLDGGDSERERVAAALTYKHKPVVNNEHKREFPFCETTIICKGKIEHLEPKFTVLQTD